MASDKIDVLVFDDETGEVTVQGASSGRAARPRPLRRSYLGQEGGYTSTVRLDGHRVYIRALSMQEFNDYAAEEKAILAAMQQVVTRSHEPGVNGEGIEAAALAIAGRRRALYSALIVKHVLRWELPDLNNGPLPCTPETKAAMPADIALELAMLILQKSRLGQDESAAPLRGRHHDDSTR